MQSNIIRNSVEQFSSKTLRRCPSGHVLQTRNHVKIYPWRHCRTNTESYLDTRRTPDTDKHNINEFRPSRFQRKPWMKVVYKDRDIRFTRYKWHEAYTSDPVEAKETARDRLNRFTQSLSDRGAARTQRKYSPPSDVEVRILEILEKLPGALKHNVIDEKCALSTDLNQSKDFKCDIISRCITAFGHDLPSSALNDINTIADLVQYYSTPVRGIDPYSSLVSENNSLPPNLAILSEALRFDKESDQCFGGYTAMPGLISEVPGLRAKKKYQVLNQDEFQWPDI